MKDFLIHLILVAAFGVITLFSVSIYASTLYAQSPTASPGASPQLSPGQVSEPIQTNEFTGEITRIEENQLFINVGGSVRTVSLPQNIKITKNNMDASQNEISVGDQVTVTQSENGQVLSISAVSGSVFQWGTYLLIGLGVLAALALVVVLLSKKGGSVKTVSS